MGGGGGGGMGGWAGDFEIEFPANACRKKPIACSTNGIKKFLHCCKKKNVTRLFHHSDSFKKYQRTCNHSSLAPF